MALLYFKDEKYEGPKQFISKKAVRKILEQRDAKIAELEEKVHELKFKESTAQLRIARLKVDLESYNSMMNVQWAVVITTAIVAFVGWMT